MDTQQKILQLAKIFKTKMGWRMAGVWKKVLPNGKNVRVNKKGKKYVNMSGVSSSTSPWGGNTATLESNGVSVTLVNAGAQSSSASNSSPFPSVASSSSTNAPNGVSRRDVPDSPPVLENYSIKCDRCGRFGVNRTFQVKKKNFCSLQCSKAMGKKGDGTTAVRSTARILASDAEDMDGGSSSSPVDGHSTVRSSSSASNSVNDYDAEGAPKKKMKKVEVDPTFDWKTVVNTPDFEAAGVGLMKHAPLARTWHNVTVGMKLEVENKDIDPRNQQVAFWAASVVKIHGYLVLLRFEGFENDSSGDFWINLCSPEIHHVGWCAAEGKPLIPPRSISRKFNDWRTFLMNRLTGATTLPQNFQSMVQRVQTNLKSKYGIGDQLEMVDKNRLCQLRVATVSRTVGRRLQVEYFDSVGDGGFWCHEESRLIHPKGWAKTIGHKIVAPKSYNPQTLLPKKYDAKFERLDLQVGMKLEAIDPLNLSAICASTIMKVLRRGYVMVRVDCDEEDSNSNGSDWFCYHITSPYVFPCGFCQENNITLTPPYGYDKSDFNWDSYLAETGYRAAPVKQQKAINHKFRVGMKVEAADIMNPRLICVATISHIAGRLLKIHFDGWEEEYDQWLDASSRDIYPVGWCELVNHKLEAPGAPPKPMQPVKKGKKGKKGKAGIRGGKPGPGPGRPAKNANAVSMASAPPVTKKSLPAVKVGAVPVKASQISSGPRRSSLQQHGEQARVVKTPATTTTITGSNGDLESNAVTCSTSMGSESMGNSIEEMETEDRPSGDEEPSSTAVTPPIEAMNGDAVSNNVVSGDMFKTDNSMKKLSTDSESNGSGASSTTTHKIPRLTDNPGCYENVDPSAWGPTEVVSFLYMNECGAHSEGVQRNKITGQTLLQLTQDQIVILTGMKVGPALKILDLIAQLKRFVTAAKARNDLGK